MNPRLLLLPVAACLALASCQSKNSDAGDDQAEISAPKIDINIDPAAPNPQFADALAAVNANGPQVYPDIVTPLPDAKDLAKIPTDELMTMLTNWNPALREQAAAALAAREDEVMPTLIEGTRSDNWKVRAGSATALEAIAQSKIKQAPRAEQDGVRQKLSHITAEFTRLCGDERLEVRSAALDGIVTLSPSDVDAVKAVLNLCADPDEHLSQRAMVAIRKGLSVKGVDEEIVLSAFRSSFESPLPNGKGNIVIVIDTMSPEFQRKLTPELVEFVAWRPRRDTMFAGAGQEQAIKMLAKMKETAVIPHLPMAMGKIQRGEGLFSIALDAIKSFGKDAKVLLPELKDIYADCKANGQNAKIRPNRDLEKNLEKLKQTIDHLESL